MKVNPIITLKLQDEAVCEIYRVFRTLEENINISGVKVVLNGTTFRKLVSFMRKREQSIIAESTYFLPP